MEEGAQLVQLRRTQNSTPWGFRLQGGCEYGSCLYIQKVTARSVADKAGLQVGDGIVKIGLTPALSLNHDAAKMEILRAGNDLDLLVKRGAIDVSKEEEREALVSEERTPYTAYTNPNVQSRSFKFLQASLKQDESQ